MRECVNCCARVAEMSETNDLEILKTTPPVTVAFALNYIYKVSGKRMPEFNVEDKSEECRRLCLRCLGIAFDMYQIQQKFTAATKPKSAANQAFGVIDALPEPQADKISTGREIASASAAAAATEEVDDHMQNQVLDITSRISNNESGQIPIPIIEIIDIDDEEVQPCDRIQNKSTDIPEELEQTQSQLEIATNRSEGVIYRSQARFSFTRYKGLCSELNCNHSFQEATKQEVIHHFHKMHNHSLKFVTKCHLCAKRLSDTPQYQKAHFKFHSHKRLIQDIELMFLDCLEFNDKRLFSKCGLELKLEEPKTNSAEVVPDVLDANAQFPMLYNLLAAEVDAFTRSDSTTTRNDIPSSVATGPGASNSTKAETSIPDSSPVASTSTSAAALPENVSVLSSATPDFTSNVVSGPVPIEVKASSSTEPKFTHLQCGTPGTGTSSTLLPGSTPLRIKCSQCGQVCKTPVGMKLHIRRHHKQITDSQNISSKERAHENARSVNPKDTFRQKHPVTLTQVFPCTDCGKVYKVKKCLAHHAKTHKPNPQPRKLYTCEEPNCSYSVRSSLYFKNHIRAHGDGSLRNYALTCKRCNRAFPNLAKLMYHGGFCCDPLQKPHACANCGRRFKQKTTLKVHYQGFHRMNSKDAHALVYSDRCSNASAHSESVPDPIPSSSELSKYTATLQAEPETMESAPIETSAALVSNIPVVSENIAETQSLYILPNYDDHTEKHTNLPDPLAISLNILSKIFEPDSGKKFQKKMKNWWQLKYSGSCSEPICEHYFQRSSRHEIRTHFSRVHQRIPKFVHLCHLCGLKMRSVTERGVKHLRTHAGDPELLLRDLIQFNKSTLSSQCGLRLRLDACDAIHEMLNAAPDAPSNGPQDYPAALNEPEASEINVPRSTSTDVAGSNGCPKRSETPDRSHSQLQSRNLEKSIGISDNVGRGQEAPVARVFACSDCDNAFYSKEDFNQHSKSHRQNLPLQLFFCKEPGCTHSVKREKSLWKHRRTVHSGTPKIRFECNRCSQGFPSGPTLRDHQAYCCDPLQRPHLCKTCGKRFRTKYTLGVHYKGLHKMSSEDSRAMLYRNLPAKPKSKAPKSTESVQSQVQPVQSPSNNAPKNSSKIRSVYIIPDNEFPEVRDDMDTDNPLALDNPSKAKSRLKSYWTNRYSGPCSEDNCEYKFQRMSRLHIMRHFEQVHHRKFKVVELCHICEGAVKNEKERIIRHLKGFHPYNGEIEVLLGDWDQFNGSVLRSRCGLKLDLVS